MEVKSWRFFSGRPVRSVRGLLCRAHIVSGAVAEARALNEHSPSSDHSSVQTIQCSARSPWTPVVPPTVRSSSMPRLTDERYGHSRYMVWLEVWLKEGTWSDRAQVVYFESSSWAALGSVAISDKGLLRAG